MLSPCSKVGGYAGDSLIGGFCLIGGGRRVEIRLHFCSVRCKNRGSGGRSLPPTVHRTVGFNFSNLLSDKNCRPPLWGVAHFGGPGVAWAPRAPPPPPFLRPPPPPPPPAPRFVIYTFCPPLSDKFPPPPLWGSAIFGGECEIRTHGALPHHRFSRPAP